MDRICKILVVEDDESVRELLGDALDYAGYEFVLADGAAAMHRAFDHDDFDVAIIDISLRGGEDGLALAEWASDKGCGVILTTGDPQQRGRLQLSGRHHLIKPFRVRQLVDLVALVLKDGAALCRPGPAGGAALLAVP